MQNNQPKIQGAVERLAGEPDLFKKIVTGINYVDGYRNFLFFHIGTEKAKLVPAHETITQLNPEDEFQFKVSLQHKVKHIEVKDVNEMHDVLYDVFVQNDYDRFSTFYYEEYFLYVDNEIRVYSIYRGPKNYLEIPLSEFQWIFYLSEVKPIWVADHLGPSSKFDSYNFEDIQNSLKEYRGY